MTGIESHHKKIHHHVVDFLEKKSKKKKIRVMHNADYISETGMNDLGQWATGVEIIATATLLNTG